MAEERAFKIDFVDDTVIRWTATRDGAIPSCDSDYAPTIHVGIRGDDVAKLDRLESALVADPKVTAVSHQHRLTGLGDRDPRPVLAVTVERIDDVGPLARELRTYHEFGTYAPGTLELYGTDFTPEFRYCLDTDIDPVPAVDLTSLEIEFSETGLVDGDLTELRLATESMVGDDERILETVSARIDAIDPDLLVVNTASIVPVLSDRAAALDLDDFALGRQPGYRQLAGESEMQTYGQILHSPARYTVPGRAIIDRSNSFMWGTAGLPGLLDLVGRSRKPIQEAGWASIGNLLTAIQIRAADERGILIPGTKVQYERFKSVRTLHDADRGGFTFDPKVGMHRAVDGLDFSSLYPNIMIEHNISPETVCCSCHADREDVPDLGYSICDRPGFIPDVLADIVHDRDAIKTKLREGGDSTDIDTLESQSEALKWVLVTCFGYQGYKNSKFGRIEAHEAINAYARDILLTAKSIFESHGWRIIHGIVDSIWVEPAAGVDPTPLSVVADDITAAIGIRLEHEHHYDWICFVPRRASAGGALTKYFGKIRGEDSYKVRGIELRQRSTPPYVATAQRTFMDALDRHRTAAGVLEVYKRSVGPIRAGTVDPDELVVRQRVSKPLEAYTQSTLAVGALERYRAHGIDKRPGQDVRFVVVDKGARRPADRVRLAFESIDHYDADFYSTCLRRACESIVSPLGLDRHDIRRAMRSHRNVALSAFEE